MKRYEIEDDGNNAGWALVESPDGEWVRAADLDAAVAAEREACATAAEAMHAFNEGWCRKCLLMRTGFRRRIVVAIRDRTTKAPDVMSDETMREISQHALNPDGPPEASMSEATPKVAARHAPRGVRPTLAKMPTFGDLADVHADQMWVSPELKDSILRATERLGKQVQKFQAERDAARAEVGHTQDALWKMTQSLAASEGARSKAELNARGLREALSKARPYLDAVERALVDAALASVGEAT